jgi:hypothetical protein
MLLNREIPMDTDTTAVMELYYNYKWARNLLDNLTWAKRLLASTHAVNECEEHGYFTDNFDKEAVEDAVKLAAANPPRGLSPDEAVKVVRQAIQIIEVECHECASNDRDYAKKA